MSDSVRQAAEELIRRARASGHVGKTIARDEMDRLVADTEGRIPPWPADLLVSKPLSGLELGWQAYAPEADFDGVMWLEISDAKNFRNESLECYPGLAILDRGFINIASCSQGSGDPSFISADEGDDPPVYQVYHDVSDQPDARGSIPVIARPWKPRGERLSQAKALHGPPADRPGISGSGRAIPGMHPTPDWLRAVNLWRGH